LAHLALRGIKQDHHGNVLIAEKLNRNTIFEMKFKGKPIKDT
jgi:hypothetical protein